MITIKDLKESVKQGEKKEIPLKLFIIEYFKTIFPHSEVNILDMPNTSDIDGLLTINNVLHCGIEIKERNVSSTSFDETICRDLKYETSLELQKHLKIKSYMFIKFLKDNKTYMFDLEMPSRLDTIKRMDRGVERIHAFYSIKDAIKINEGETK